jgi:hypothetical protein
MSTNYLASIHYGYILEADEIELIPEETVEAFIDDDWYIGEHYGQSFYYHSWTDDALVLGIECYDTDDVIGITPYAISKIVEETTEGLKEIYKNLFPGRDVKEPSVLLIQRVFN